MTAKITPKQASRMCELIGKGLEVGGDSDGNMVYADTKLSEAMDLLGMQWQLIWTGGKCQTEPVVAMLRDWANALEKLNER